MNNSTLKQNPRKVRPPGSIQGLIQILHNIQLHINSASGAATALELRLKAIAQLDPRVQAALRTRTSSPYHNANLNHLIDAVLETFHDALDSADQETIKSCRVPRNKEIHGSFVELMIALCGKAPGREIDTTSFEYVPLEESDIIEGAKCIERNGGLDEFTRRVKEAIAILEQKVLTLLDY